MSVLPSQPVDLTPETLAHVARLSRLRLDDAEFEHLREDIRAVLTLFEDLSEAPPLDEVPAAGSPREDVVKASGDVAPLLANVPKLKDGRIEVGRWE